MATTLKTAMEQLGISSRRVAAALISGVWRHLTLAEVEERLTALPRAEQRLVVGGVIAAVFALSLFAAQFGWVAMLVYWLAVVAIVN